MEPMPSEDLLRERLNALKAQFDILTEKLSDLRTEHAMVAGGARKFELQQMISTKEEEWTRIDEEIAAIEEQLRSGVQLNRHQDKSLDGDPMSSEDVLRKKRNELKQKFDLLAQKLTYLRTEFAVAASGSHRFQLTQDIQTTEQELAIIDDQLKQMDEQIDEQPKNGPILNND